MPRFVPISNFEQFQAINLSSDPGYAFKDTAIPNCASVRLNWQLMDGKIAHNILHCQYTGTPAFSAALAQSVFTAITSGATWTALLGHINNATSLTGVTITDVRDMVSPSYTSTGAPIVGTGTGTALPDESALVVSLRTGNRGRSGRGRAYHLGMLGSDVAAGNLAAPGLVTALQGWYAGALASGVATVIGPLVLGLHHRLAYNSPVTGAPIKERLATTVPITSYVVDNHFDTQRRRGLK